MLSERNAKQTHSLHTWEWYRMTINWIQSKTLFYWKLTASLFVGLCLSIRKILNSRTLNFSRRKKIIFPKTNEYCGSLSLTSIDENPFKTFVICMYIYVLWKETVCIFMFAVCIFMVHSWWATRSGLCDLIKDFSTLFWINDWVIKCNI